MEDNKTLYTKADLAKIFNMKSWNTIKKHFIDTGILPKGKPLGLGRQVYWHRNSIEKAKKELEKIFNEVQG